MTFQYDKSDVSFLICDDIREEINGRQSLMGVYLRNEVTVEDKTLTVLPSLGIFFRLDNLRSTVTFSARLVTPQMELGTIGPDSLPKQQTTLVLNLRVAPFPVHEGICSLIVNVDGVDIVNNFTVSYAKMKEHDQRQYLTSTPLK